MMPRRKPKFYVAGTFSDYTVRERTAPYQDASELIVMKTDVFTRARVVARALNESETW